MPHHEEQKPLSKRTRDFLLYLKYREQQTREQLRTMSPSLKAAMDSMDIRKIHKKMKKNTAKTCPNKEVLEERKLEAGCDSEPTPVVKTNSRLSKSE